MQSITLIPLDHSNCPSPSRRRNFFPLAVESHSVFYMMQSTDARERMLISTSIITMARDLLIA